jgi:hypothetical protein
MRNPGDEPGFFCFKGIPDRLFERSRELNAQHFLVVVLK